MFTARACGKQILGNNATVAGRLNVWFNSGAAHYYQISRHTINKIPVTNQTVQSVFQKFDAIAEYGQGSEISYRPDKYSLPQWYADGTLKLKGFYLSNNYKAVPYNKDDDACYLLFSSKPCAGVKGFMAYNNEAVSEYKQDSIGSGNYFLSIILPDTSFHQPSFDSIFKMYTRFVYPDINGKGFMTLVWGVTVNLNKEALLKSCPHSAGIKDLVLLKAEAINKTQLLNYKDQPVKFYSGLKEIEAGADYYR